MSYADDRAWSDAYLPTVRAIVGPHLLVPAPIERDIKEASDLIVLRARDMTIAVRLRRPGYADQYPNQFTIRAHRSSGAKTELAKINEGWGDWFFYGHTSATDIVSWLLIDLHWLRAAFIRQASILHFPDNRVSGIKHNGDGTQFFWFDASRLPSNVIIASSGQLRQAA